MSRIKKLGAALRKHASTSVAIPTASRGEIAGDLQSNVTTVSTIFTVLDGNNLLYSAHGWIRVTLQLETAGPVSVGTKANLMPLLGGAGALLVTGQPFTIVMGRSDRLYYTAGTVNRVRFIVEPIPWMQQIAMQIADVVGSINGAGTYIATVFGRREQTAPPLTNDPALRRLKNRRV